MEQFDKPNKTIIKNGDSPKAYKNETVGERKPFEIHHVKQIQYGGDVYDMENLRVNTPRNHIRIHKNER